MYKFFVLFLVMVQPPPEQAPVQQPGGIGFFKLVNKSDVTIEVEISDGKKFAQIALVKPKKDHLMAVKEGGYTCAIRGSDDKKSCTVNAGEIIQIDFPWPQPPIKEITPKQKPPDPLPKELPKEDPLPKELPKEDPLPKEVAKTEDIPQPKVEEPKPGPKNALIEINGLPEDAELWFDDHKAPNTKQRWFKTPDLELVGITYYYILRAEVRRNDRIYVARKHVTVRAGQKTVVNFDLPK